MAAIYHFFPAKVNTIYTLFAGTDTGGREIIDYCSFDGTTITNMAGLGYVVGNPSSSVEGRFAAPTYDNGVACLLLAGEVRSYMYTASSGGYFVNTYGRNNDWDSIGSSIATGQMIVADDKLIVQSTVTGLVTLSASEVASNIDSYADVPPTTPGDAAGKHAGHTFCWHNGYLIAMDWTNQRPYVPSPGVPNAEATDQRYESIINAFSWDGSSLTKIDDDCAMHPVLVPWNYSYRLASDGNYIYGSCLYNHSGKIIWSMPDWGWHSGIQVMTFDGATLTHIVISADGIENQVPWYGAPVPGVDEWDKAGVLSMVCGNGYIFVLGTDGDGGYNVPGATEKTLYCYTFDEINYFTEIDRLIIPAGYSSEILYEATNKWLIVDCVGVFDVSDGTFNNQIAAGNFKPTLSQASYIHGNQGGSLFTTPLNDGAVATRHSQITANLLLFRQPNFWFDFQDQLINSNVRTGPHAIGYPKPGARSAFAQHDWDFHLLQANNILNLTILPPIRTGMQQAVQLDSTFMEDQGTDSMADAWNGDDNGVVVFTIGCQGPVTQMAGYHSRDAADQTWSSYFLGNDLVLEFNSTIDEVLTFTLAGLADGALHVVAFMLNLGSVEVQYDNVVYTSQAWTGATALKSVSKPFMFGGDTTWATQTSNGVFTDLWMNWYSDDLDRSELNALVTQIYGEIL